MSFWKMLCLVLEYNEQSGTENIWCMSKGIFALNYLHDGSVLFAIY